jgi:predicted Zn-dependent protease
MGRLIGLDLQRAYEGLHQHDKAVAVADELLKRYPDDPEILFHSSRLYADRAYELMTQLMRVAPSSVWLHYATAEVHASLQRYDLAILEYRKVLEMEPRMPGIHCRLGRAILQGSKETSAAEQAMHEFEQELAVSPDNSDAEYEIGEIYRQRSQFEPALAHFYKAVQHHPDFTQARIGLASTLISQGRSREALPHLLEAVRTEPQNEVAHFRLASVYKVLGDAANQQREMALFQKLHSAGASNAPALSGPSVTPQMIETESHMPP